MYTKINFVNKNPALSTHSLVSDLIERKTFETAATKHGIAMEIHAKEQLKKIINSSHSNCTFQESGMVIDEDLPFLSVSPDLEGTCKCCGDFVVEIKCPYSICETKPSSQNLDYLHEVNTITKLKASHSYYTNTRSTCCYT